MDKEFLPYFPIWKINPIYDVTKLRRKYEILSLDPSTTWDTVVSNPSKHWSFDLLSLNKNINWNIVYNNPDKPWNWKFLSKNPSITPDIKKANPNYPWI